MALIGRVNYTFTQDPAALHDEVITDHQHPPTRAHNRKRTMPALIAQLREKYNSDMAIAAALGITRQALSQASRRGRLSEHATIAAAELLEIDPGAALLANATPAANPPAPILNPAANLPSQPPKNAPDNTNYARNGRGKLALSGNPGSMFPAGLAMLKGQPVAWPRDGLLRLRSAVARKCRAVLRSVIRGVVCRPVADGRRH